MKTVCRPFWPMLAVGCTIDAGCIIVFPTHEGVLTYFPYDRALVLRCVISRLR